MNKPPSELIALADAIHAWQQNPATTYTPTNILQDHGDTVVELARLAANQSGRRPGVDALREALVTARECIWSGGNTISTLKTIDTVRATPPAQPAPAATHGKPDGAVREALARAYLIGRGFDSCRIDDYQSANFPEWKAALEITSALHSPKIAAAETSLGNVLAMRDALVGLNGALDRYWEGDNSKTNIIAICGWQEKCKTAIDRFDVKAEAKSQEPDAGQLSVRGFREDAFRSMEVQICGDTRTVQFGVEDHGGDHPTMPCCALSWTDAADLASWVQSCIAHPTTKPEAPAVSVDAINNLLGVRNWLDLQFNESPLSHDLAKQIGKLNTAIAALIAGGR